MYSSKDPYSSLTERNAAASDTGQYGALFRHLLERGVYVAPSQFECMFVSAVHGEDEVDRTVAAVRMFFDAVD